jgi:hypothetical protein
MVIIEENLMTKKFLYTILICLTLNAIAVRAIPQRITYLTY